MGMTWVLGLALLLVVGWYLFFSATRLDRIHARVEGARSALDAQLVRRASVSLQLAVSGLLDPATSLLVAGAAHEAREADDADRELAESNLTRALHAAFDESGLPEALDADPAGQALIGELAGACLRVELARRFLNDAVRGARVVRRKRAVRYARLAGHAPWPPTFEMDDTPPPGLMRGGRAAPSTVLP
ncbi:MAG: hypothetical protein QOJ68_3388 [Blastococcus sp.]|jgi:hypothetical protein|nr:hypothetical protein [Blastococcus sp.]